MTNNFYIGLKFNCSIFILNERKPILFLAIKNFTVSFMSKNSTVSKLKLVASYLT